MQEVLVLSSMFQLAVGIFCYGGSLSEFSFINFESSFMDFNIVFCWQIEVGPASMFVESHEKVTQILLIKKWRDNIPEPFYPEYVESFSISL